MGSQRVGHDWAIFTFTYKQTSLWITSNAVRRGNQSLRAAGTIWTDGQSNLVGNLLIWLPKNQYYGHHNPKTFVRKKDGRCAIFVRKKDGRCAIKGSAERKHFPQFTMKKRGMNEQMRLQETNQHKQNISIIPTPGKSELNFNQLWLAQIF